MTTRSRWILLPLAALAAILIVGVMLFDWNWFKGPVETMASAALGRDVEFAGDLDVDLGAAPTITFEQVRIANAAWGSRPNMLTIAQVAFALDLGQLLRGTIALPFLRVHEPDLLLETSRQGEGNWQFGPPDQESGAPSLPTIEHLQITGATIRYHEPDRPEDLVARLEAVNGALTSAEVEVDGDGTLNREPLSLHLASAPIEQLEAEVKRFPFELDAELGSTRLTATGSAEAPLQAQGLSIEITVDSPNPGTLMALAGRDAADLSDLHLALSVTREDQIWAVPQLNLRLGQSDLRGHATVQFGKPEPVIAADFVSDQIRLEDFGGLLPESAAEQPSAPGSDGAVDAAIAEAKAALADDEKDADREGGVRLPLDMLPAVDGEVSYTVGRLLGPELALTGLNVHARLEDGLPRLALTGSGEYENTPVTLDVQLGGKEQAHDAAYPVQARIEAADTRVGIGGVIGQPETLDGLNLEVEASSEDINRVLALAKLDLPQIPPFAVSGHVIQDGQVWRIPDFYGRLSESELTAQLTVDLSEERPFIRADLQSDRLLASDLVVAAAKPAVVEVVEAAEADGQEKEIEGPALISIEGANFDALPGIDAEVSFRGESVAFQEFRFDRLSFDLSLRDQVAVVDAAGEGQFRDGPLTLEMHAGTEQNLQNPGARYPIDLRIDSKETQATAEGTLAEPGRLAGLQVDVALRGANLDRIGEILQLGLPDTLPFDLHSHLSREEDDWHFEGLRGTIGDSDIQGDATIVLGGERPLLEAALTSNRLDFDDLGLLVGAPADPDETVSVEQQRMAAEEAATPGVLPDEPFDVLELRAMDARVSYRAKRVQAPNLPLEGVELALTLEGGQLTLEPLRFDLADGALDAVIRLDGRTDTLSGEIDLGVRNIRLNRLLAHFDLDLAEIEVEQEGVGTLGGRAHLTVEGNSIEALAGSADGNAAIIMDGGRISSLVIEGLGLDVGEVLALFATEGDATESEMVPVQCFVGRFDLEDGVMKTEALVLETSDSTITGKGQIDLGAETIALELLAHPKDASVLSASTPVRIEGTFEDPEIDPVSEELKEKSLAALALGVVMPVVGALFPFFEEGETEGPNCARLIADASAAVPAPTSDQAE